MRHAPDIRRRTLARTVLGGAAMAWPGRQASAAPEALQAARVVVPALGGNDDTAALERALRRAAGPNGEGGAVVLPPGTWSVMPGRIRVPSRTAILGYGRASVLKRIGPGTLLDISGADTHRRVGGCLLRDVVLDGGGASGPLVRTSHAHDLVLHNIWSRNNAGIALDAAELWDSRFVDCTWDWCSGADGASPAVRLRNRGDGEASLDNTNALYFVNCRWESFRDGAFWMVPSGPSAMSQVHLVNCKMETSFVRGPFLKVAPGTRNVIVQNLYLCGNRFDAGAATPVNLVELSAFALTKLANVSVWLNAPVARTVVRAEVGHPSCAISDLWLDGSANPTLALIECAGPVRPRIEQVGYLKRSPGAVEA